MIPINYPTDIAKFKSDYIKNFDIDTMQSEYDNICRPARFGVLRGLKIKDILISLVVHRMVAVIRKIIRIYPHLSAFIRAVVISLS